MTIVIVVVATALAFALLFAKWGWARKIVALALLAYPTILITKGLTLWTYFDFVRSLLRGAGWTVNQYLLNAVVGAGALVLYGVVPIALLAFLKAQKWKFVATVRRLVLRHEPAALPSVPRANANAGLESIHW